MPERNRKGAGYVTRSLRESKSLRKYPSSGYPAYGSYLDPSRYWGEKLDLPEIYETYSDVLGQDHARFQKDYLSKKKPGEHLSVIEDLFERLCAGHPDLPRDLASTESAMRHIVFGCVSKFNADDIRHFLIKAPAGNDLEWRKRKREVEVLTGNWHLEWCASPATLNHIEARVRELGPNFNLLP